MDGRRRRIAVVALAAALLLASPPGSEAQAIGGEERAETIGSDTVAYELEELVVTAARGPVARGRIPWRTTVLDGDELRSSGVHFLETALRGVPGLSLASQGPRGSLTSLFLRGGESDYVKVMVDGIPVNQPGGAYDLAHLTAGGVERVEVLRGPGSVLYGSDAMTGVVQIFTEAGDDERVQASVRGGSQGTLVLDLAASGGTERAGYGASVSRYATDGMLPFNNEYRNVSASGRVRLRPDRETRAALTARYLDTEYHFPTDVAGRVVDENQYQTRDESVVGLEVRRALPEGLALTVGAATRSLSLGVVDRRDGPADTTGTFASESQRDQDRHSGEVMLDWRPDGDTRLTVGASVEQSEETGFSAFTGGFGTSTSHTRESRSSRAVFVQAIHDVVDPVTVTLGARVDDNSAFGTFDTYRAGAAYRIGSDTRLRAAIGTGFKAPTFFENFATGFVRGNPDLEPERTTSWEGGLTHSFGETGLTLAATYFSQTFRDLIQFTVSPPEPEGPNYFNVAEADASGLELEADYAPHSRLSFRAGYTYLETEVVDSGFDEGPDATFVEGEALLRRPAHAASLDVSARPFDRVELGLGVDWVGERTDRDFSESPAPRVTLDDHLRMDASARFHLGGAGPPGLAPLVRVENVLDAEYREIAGFAARGRTLTVGISSSLGF